MSSSAAVGGSTRKTARERAQQSIFCTRAEGFRDAIMSLAVANELKKLKNNRVLVKRAPLSSHRALSCSPAPCVTCAFARESASERASERALEYAGDVVV